MHRDSPDDLIVDYFDDTAFPNQPLGRSILSTEAQVASYTRDDLIQYMGAHYKPPQMVLSAAGNIQHDALVMLAQDYFALEAAHGGPTPPIAVYRGGDKRVADDLEQLQLAIGLPAVPIHSPAYYPLQIYANILGGGMSSRLFQEVREKRGLAYSVYAMGSSYEDVGIMSIYAATAPEKGGELSLVLAEEIAGMAAQISDAELSRAKNQMKAELLMSRESPQNVAMWIGKHLLMFDEYRRVGEILEKIDAVTKADVLALAESLRKGALTVAALGEIGTVASYEAMMGKLG